MANEKRILIYASEGDSRAQDKLEALKADLRQAGRRNAELWEGNLEPTIQVFIFPNNNVDAIAEAYRAAGVSVEIVSNENDETKNEISRDSEDVKAEKGQSNQAKKVRTRRVKS